MPDAMPEVEGLSGAGGLYTLAHSRRTRVCESVSCGGREAYTLAPRSSKSVLVAYASRPSVISDTLSEISDVLVVCALTCARPSIKSATVMALRFASASVIDPRDASILKSSPSAVIVGCATDAQRRRT